jgi:hypothetical protein
LEITKPAPGDWEGPVILIGKGTDGNLYETKTSDGKTWTTPTKIGGSADQAAVADGSLVRIWPTRGTHVG